MCPVHLSEALTFWTALHPAWTPNPEWPRDVGFVTWLAPNCFVLIDPLVRDDLDAAAWEPFDRVLSDSGRPAAVLLTAPWHERSARAVAERYGAPIWIHPQGRDRLGEVPELSELPSGIETFVPGGMDEGQVAFYIAPERALVVAEFLLGANDGLRVRWSPATRDMAEFAASLEQLRKMAIDRVLVAHGAPVLEDADKAIEAALDAFTSKHLLS